MGTNVLVSEAFADERGARLNLLAVFFGVGALFVLRRTQPGVPRPYRCTGYPVLPALYIVIGVAWAVNTAIVQPRESLAGIAIVALGVPVYLYWRRRQAASPES